MKPLILVAALGLIAATYTFPTVDRSGTVRMIYDADRTATIDCSPTVTCAISLLPGDEIQDIVSPGSVKRFNKTGWIIDQGAQGNTPYIYITPQVPNFNTTLFVTTKGHAYAMNLLAHDHVAHWLYAFDRRATPPPATPTPAPSATPTATPAPDIFRITLGRFRPSSVTREGNETIILLPPGDYPMPDVVAIEGDATIPVPHSDDPDKRTITVHGIYPTLLLYVGEGKQRQSVEIQHVEDKKR